MNLSRPLLGLLLIISVVMAGPSCAKDDTSREQTSSSGQQQEGSQTKWLGFNDGVVKAKTEDKPIFVEFYTDWCPYCKKFQKETVNERNVTRMLAENFVYVRLNAEDSKNRVKFQGKSLSNVELTNSLGISAYPSLVFLDSGGQPITMLSGFVPARQFLSVLDYIQQKCYQTQISFRDFTKMGNCN